MCVGIGAWCVVGITRSSTPSAIWPPTYTTGGISIALELRRNCLFGLQEDIYQLLGAFVIGGSEERERCSDGTRTSRTSDSMHIIFDTCGEIVIDHVLDVFHVSTLGCRLLSLRRQSFFCL